MSCVEVARGRRSWRTQLFQVTANIRVTGESWCLGELNLTNLKKNLYSGTFILQEIVSVLASFNWLSTITEEVFGERSTKYSTGVILYLPHVCQRGSRRVPYQ